MEPQQPTAEDPRFDATTMLDPDEVDAPLEVAPGLSLVEPPPQWQHGGGPPPLMPRMPILAMPDDDSDADRITVAVRKREEAEMDMTPMVDVTFQLLIFFMLTTSFDLQKSLGLPKPKQAAAGASTTRLEELQDDPNVVTVRVDPSGSFLIETASAEQQYEATSEQELLSRLREAKGSDGANKLLVLAHGEATHERVVMAVDAGAVVGMDEVQLLSTEEE